MDGSPPVFYMSENKKSDKWLVLLEGGEYCNSAKSCRSRMSNKMTKYLSTSKNHKISFEGIISRSKRENQLFYDSNVVLIPYCSQDLWLGDTEQKYDRKKWGHIS